MKRYLISGIGPGTGGVGRLMQVLVPKYKAMGYEVIYKREPKSIKTMIKGWKFICSFFEIIDRVTDGVHFKRACKKIYNADVVFLHPQTAGYDVFFGLVARNNISLYVMDNSFFCIQSYNNNPVSKLECLQCIGEINPDAKCSPFPVQYKKEDNIEKLEKLKAVSSEINFLAQNNMQRKLLEKHFGEHIIVEVVGMDAEEAGFSYEEKGGGEYYDLVFHAAPLAAKGMFYFIDLAKHLPEYSFFIPSSESNVLHLTELSSLPANIICSDMRWETGLLGIVSNARIVVNPSMWSAPIEGALIKSMKYNENVATVKTEFGYEAEIQGVRNHIRLSIDAKDGAQEIRGFLSGE